MSVICEIIFIFLLLSFFLVMLFGGGEFGPRLNDGSFVNLNLGNKLLCNVG